MYPEMFGGKPCEGEASETVVCSRTDCPGKKSKRFDRDRLPIFYFHYIKNSAICFFIFSLSRRKE